MRHAASCVVFLLFASLGFAEDAKVSKGHYGGSFYATTKAGDVCVVPSTPTVYLLRGQTQEIYYSLLGVYLKHDGKLAEFVGGVFNVGGRPVSVDVSTDSSSLKIRNKGDIGREYVFTQEGVETVIVKVGDDSMKIPLQVSRLDFDAGDPVSLLIDKYGFPSEKKRIIVSWPTSETHDDIYYKAEAGNPVMVQHWRFDKVPDAVFAVRDDKLVAVRGNLKASEAFNSDMDTWFPKAADSEPAMEVAKEEEFPTWTAADGSVLSAKFIGLIKGEVVMQKPNGSRVRIALSKFSATDAAKIKELNQSAKK